MAPELRKRTKAQAAPEKPAAVKKTKATTKRQATEDASPVSVKKQKTVVKEVKSKKPVEEAKPARAAVKETKKKATKAKPEEAETEKAEELATEEAETSIIPVDDASGSDADNDDEIDADIQALAAGLDPEDDDGRTGDTAVYKAGQDIGKIPSNKLTKKEKKALAARNGAKGEPGVIYVGRLPHGFYEHELRGYFGQFGPVSRLRLSRNKKTGKSKHYAFIEFSEESTAHIAAKTMDKYLLFGHILTVKFVEKDQLHADVWKGANRRFKQTPWAKIAGNKLARPVTESAWEERIEKEKQRRVSRAEKLKELGYEFEAPALKAAPAPLPIEEAEKPEAIEAASEEEKETNGAPEVVAEVEAEVVDETPEPVKAKKAKAKKAKKVKA